MSQTQPESPSIERHLREWLGAWPSDDGIEVVGWPGREEPGWDGAVHPIVGVLTPTGGVLSVPPDVAGAVRGHVDAGGDLRHLPEVAGRPGGRYIEGMYRYSTAPTDLPDAGVWRPVDDPAVPAWLRPFGGEVLVVLDDDGRYVAGVGLKKHDRFGHEIAVGTEPAARGRGLARRIVAQAARAVLAEGAVPTYLHAFDNLASGKVAEAAGFPDRGWRTVGVFGGLP